MNRMMIVMSVVLASAFVFAAEPTPEEAAKKAARMQRMMEKTGGIVEKAGVGKVVVINAQAKASKELLNELAGKFKAQTRFEIEVRDGACEMYKRPDDATAAVVIVDDPALPMSVVALENVWGLVNVAKLGETNFDLRLTKEFVRVTTLAFGGSISQFKGSALNPATNAEMLDKYVCDNYTIDNAQSIMRNLGGLGMEGTKRASYRKAIQEGWAAQPTNEYQKIIWEELHASPTNPMRIKFDPKKGL